MRLMNKVIDMESYNHALGNYACDTSLAVANTSCHQPSLPILGEWLDIQALSLYKDCLPTCQVSYSYCQKRVQLRHVAVYQSGSVMHPWKSLYISWSTWHYWKKLVVTSVANNEVEDTSSSEDDIAVNAFQRPSSSNSSVWKVARETLESSLVQSFGIKILE